MDPRPIGVFDSGVGGLSVVEHLRAMVPAERFVYFADTDFFPYGPRPPAEVRKRAFSIADRLLRADVKMIVIACNTASTAAVKDLREVFDIPFVAMVPALKPAAAQSRSGIVAVLATSGTIDGEMLAKVNKEFGQGTDVRNIPCQGLAELVELGDTESTAVREHIRESLEPAVRAGADTRVLGCTHFHFLTATIESEFPGLTVIGTAEPVARRVVQVLTESDSLAPNEVDGSLSLIVSGNRFVFEEVIKKLGFLPAGALA